MISGDCKGTLQLISGLTDTQKVKGPYMTAGPSKRAGRPGLKGKAKEISLSGVTGLPEVKCPFQKTGPLAMEGTIPKVTGMLLETQGTPPVTKGTSPEIEGRPPEMKGVQRQAAAATAAPVQIGIILNGVKSPALVMKLPQLWQEMPLLLLQPVSFSSFQPACCMECSAECTHAAQVSKVAAVCLNVQPSFLASTIGGWHVL